MDAMAGSSFCQPNFCQTVRVGVILRGVVLWYGTSTAYTGGLLQDKASLKSSVSWFGGEIRKDTY